MSFLGPIIDPITNVVSRGRRQPRKLNFLSCTFCRKAKVKCLPLCRTLMNEKCIRCHQKNLSCSAPQRKTTLSQIPKEIQAESSKTAALDADFDLQVHDALVILSLQHVLDLAVTELIAIGREMLMPLEGDSGSIGHREELDNVITGYSWLLVVFRNTLKNVSGAVAQVVLAATMNIAYVLRVWDDLEELVQDRNISQYTEKGHHGIAYVLQLRRLQYSICPADHDVHDMIHTRKVLMDSIGDVMERQHLEQDLLVGFEKRSSIDLAETQLFIPGVLLQIPAVAKAINQDGRRDCLWRPVGHILHDNKVNEKLQSRYHEDGHDVLGRSRLHIASTLDADKQRDLELLSLPRSAWPDMESLGLNALHVAAIHGNTHMFRHAAASGYDVAHSPGRHLSSHTMRTYLHWAACFGHLELVEYLLDRYGARHDLMYTLVYLDRFGDTALHLAASNGHAEVVEAILRHTDWSRMKSACFDHTPFWEATIGGHLDIMKLLVSVSNVDEKETIGRTPLAEAARLGFLEGVEYLLQLDGVAMDSINRCWDETAKKILFKTPLDLAFEGGHNECAALLVRHGASTWQQLRA